MSSLAVCTVFSNVAATLSNTFLDQIGGDKEQFLLSLLSNDRISLLFMPPSQAFSVTGQLEDIISCREKLLKGIVSWNQRNGSIDRNELESEQNDSDGNIKQEISSTEENVTQRVEQRKIKNENAITVTWSNVRDIEKLADGNLHNKVSGENDSEKNKCLSKVSKLQKYQKKPKIQPFEENSIISEGNKGDTVITKRGRVVKRPSKLGGSIILLEEQGNEPGLENHKPFVQRKNKNKNSKHVTKISGETDSVNNGGSRTSEKGGDLASDVVDAETGTTESGDIKTGIVEEIETDFNKDIDYKKERDEKKKMRRRYEDSMPFRFFCTKCSFKSKRESHFKNHMLLHQKNPELKLFKCGECDYTCVRQSLLKKHTLEHEPDEDLLKCDSCKYKTDSQEKLFLHILQSHGSKKNYRWKCSHCFFRTYSKIKLMKHLNSHSVKINENTTESFNCDECSFTTLKRVHFKRHKLNVHSNIRPFLCDLCGAAFKRTDTLSAHKVTHMDVSKRKLPFRCGICSKGFKSKAHLMAHMSVHSSVRAYQCHICGQMFKTRQVQKKHQENIHYNPRSFKCSVCKKEFNTKYTLQRHERTHDSDLLYQNDGESAKKTLNVLHVNEEKNGSADKGSVVEVQDVMDENMRAIQHITLSEFTQHLQSASDQLQSGSDISTIYIEGLESVVQETGSINIVDINGQDIHQIFIPPRSGNVETQPIHPNQYITQISTAPSGGTESADKGEDSDMTNQDLDTFYVSTVTLQDNETNLSGGTELGQVYIQSDADDSEIKHLLVPSNNVQSGTDQPGEVIVDVNGSQSTL